MYRLYSGRRPSVARRSSLQVMDNRWDFFLICAGFWWLNASEMNCFTARLHSHLIPRFKSKKKKKVRWRKFCFPFLDQEVAPSGFVGNKVTTLGICVNFELSTLDAVFPPSSVLDASWQTSPRLSCVTCPPASKLMIMGRNSPPDYDLSIPADASVSRYHAALGKMVAIRSESPIRHPQPAGLRVLHKSRVQELDWSDSTAAKNPLEIWISQSFTFLALPTEKKGSRDWNSNSVSRSTYFLEPQSVWAAVETLPVISRRPPQPLPSRSLLISSLCL